MQVVFFSNKITKSIMSKSTNSEREKTFMELWSRPCNRHWNWKISIRKQLTRMKRRVGSANTQVFSQLTPSFNPDVCECLGPTTQCSSSPLKRITIELLLKQILTDCKYIHHPILTISNIRRTQAISRWELLQLRKEPILALTLHDSNLSYHVGFFFLISKHYIRKKPLRNAACVQKKKGHRQRGPILKKVRPI